MIKINCETKDFLAMDELTEFQGELKHREESDVKKIAASILKHGFAFPFFIWSHDEINHVFDGHGRLLALKYLKSKGEEIPELPVVYINAENEAEAKEMLLKLNSHYGQMTTESVLEFLDGVEIDFNDIQLPETFMDFSLETEPEETEGDDEVPEVQEEAVSQLGEMYELGNSILMCGDSTKEEDVARLMGGEKADMVFTDPPYGVSATGGRQQTKEKLGMKAIENDDLRNDDLEKFLSSFIKAMKYKEGASIYICYPWATQKEFTEAILENDLKIKNCIIWNKKVFGLNGRKGYRPQYEMIYFCCKDDFTWYGDKAQSNVWDIPREINREEQGNHPTPKPIKLIEKALLNSSKKEDLVLDVFGGSGSTLIAAEKTGRKARLMELDPHYCDVIRRRYTKWAKENGKPLTSGCLE